MVTEGQVEQQVVVVGEVEVERQMVVVEQVVVVLGQVVIVLGKVVVVLGQVVVVVVWERVAVRLVRVRKTCQHIVGVVRPASRR